MIATEPLDIDRIRDPLTASIVGSRLHLLDEVPSTNAVLHELAKAGAREGIVVLAEGQSAGRGRLGKAWFSPSGVNLYASVLFRPRIAPGEVAVFSFIAPLALFDVIQEEGVEPAIKWPNDVLIENRKVAGVLAESSLVGDRVDFVILGVGVNLNVEPGALRAALGPAGGVGRNSLRGLREEEASNEQSVDRPRCHRCGQRSVCAAPRLSRGLCPVSREAAAQVPRDRDGCGSRRGRHAGRTYRGVRPPAPQGQELHILAGAKRLRAKLRRRL